MPHWVATPRPSGSRSLGAPSCLHEARAAPGWPGHMAARGPRRLWPWPGCCVSSWYWPPCGVAPSWS
eukprot:12004075-Alexandrium_andersonii.AAC.1